MPITTTCPGCGALFRLPEDLAGKQVRCQKCAQLFGVPAPAEETPVAPVDDPILATLAEPTAAEPIPAAVVQPSEKQAEPDARPAKPTMPPADRPASVAAILAMTLIFAGAILGTGIFAVIWVAGHLSPPLSLTVVPPLHAGGNNFNDGFPGNPNQDRRFVNDVRFPEPIDFGLDATLSVAGQTQNQPGVDHLGWNRDGAYRLYRVRLLQNVKYHFLLSTPNSQGRLRIVDGINVPRDIGAKFPATRLMTAFTPAHTADYTLWISSGINPSGYELSIAEAAVFEKLFPLDLKGKAVFRAGELRLRDPLDPGRPAYGPYQDYDFAVEAGHDYLIDVNHAAFTPALVVDPQGNGPILHPKAAGPRIIHTYHPAAAGRMRIRVTSQQCGLGRYDITISRRIR